MDEKTLKAIAQQLRKPEGEYATAVGNKMNEGNKIINLQSIEAMDIQDNDEILEIGMGNGFFVKELFNINKTITYSGCDYSEEMVAEAAKLNDNLIKQNKAEFILANGKELPFNDHLFDKILTINTLYFWEDPENYFNEIKRVLKKDGKLTIGIRPRSVMKSYPFVKYGFNMFSKEELITLLTQNKFEIEKVEENMEPDQENEGIKFKVENLIAVAKIIN
ncbi:class I SAM-dependent methyltransferase [Flexithrix dorotheae]|uniref:class I SAM-dependent methyltransferase n=1 Tax=Flexithrix dorotheae TaxID=70993 RepID=UPI00035EE507|nr:class I SAM-dependent methyltransferase [Flexithrix dorotheae]